MSDRQRLETLRKRKRLEELRAMKAAEAQKPAPSIMERIAGADLKRRQMTDAAQTGIGQGLSLGFMDEIAGGAAALGAMLPGGRSPGEAYRETTDRTRDYVAAQKERNPVAFTAGEIGGGLATGLSGGARMAGIKGSAALGAGYGAGTADGDLMDRVKGAGVGALVGAGTHYGTQKLGQGVGKLLQRKPAQSAPIPELDELKAIKDAAYRRVDQQGVRYSKEQIEELIRGSSDQIPMTGPTARNTGAPADVIKRLGLVGDDGLSLSELEDLRGMAAPNKVNATPTELRDSGIVRENIDSFMEGMTPAIGPQSANELARQARSDAGRFIRSRQLDEALEAARIGAKSNRVPDELFSQRKAVAAILKNKSKRAGYSPDELKAMERFVEGSSGEKIARQIGKLGSGNAVGNSLGIGIGGLMAGWPGAIGLPVAAASVRKAGERATQNSLDDLIRAVRTGQAVNPVATPASRAVQNPRVQEILARAGAFATLY